MCDQCAHSLHTGPSVKKHSLRVERPRRTYGALGCRLLALPPYSPDLNMIETLWHQLKSRIRHNLDPDLSFRAKVDAAFCSL